MSVLGRLRRWLHLPIGGGADPQPDPPPPFVIIQTAVQSNIAGSTTQALSTAVNAGDLLLLSFTGRGFGAPPQAGVPSAVSDNINGPWTPIYNTGNVDDGASHNWCAAAYFVVSAAAGAGALTISITASVGQAGSSLAVVEYTGGATTSPLDVQVVLAKDTTDAGGTLTTPAPAAALAGDLVLFVTNGFSTSGALTVPGTQTMDATNAGAGATGGPVAIASRNTLSTAGEQPTGTFSGYFGTQQVAGATILIKQPVAAPVATTSPTDLWRQEYAGNQSGYTLTRYSDVFREVQAPPANAPTEDSWNIRLHQDHQRFF